MDLQLLKKTAIFADLDEGELARVAEICKEQKYQGGQYVFKEGEPGNRFYIIVAGEVRISRNIPGSGEEALAVLAQQVLHVHRSRTRGRGGIIVRQWIGDRGHDTCRSGKLLPLSRHRCSDAETPCKGFALDLNGPATFP